VLQTENLKITAVFGLVYPVDAVLHSLDDAVLPAANWVFEDIEEATSIKVSTKQLGSFQKNTVSSAPTLIHL